MRAAGFSLIEMVMVIIIVGILAAFIAPILSTAVDSYDTTSRNLGVLAKMRYASERVAREIRAVRRDPANTANYDFASIGSPIKLDLCRSDNTRVSVELVASELRLAYTTGFTSTCAPSAAPTLVLADGVSAFNLTYRKWDGTAATGLNDVAYIDIAMTLTDTGANSYSSNMRVDLRQP